MMHLFARKVANNVLDGESREGKRKKNVQSALVIRTTFVPLCFSEGNVLITSSTYECSYNQRNYLVFWKSVLMTQFLYPEFLYPELTVIWVIKQFVK